VRPVGVGREDVAALFDEPQTLAMAEWLTVGLSPEIKGF
jgi:hypothetical protein